MAQAQKTEITEKQSLFITQNVLLGVMSQLLHARNVFDGTVFAQKKVTGPRPLFPDSQSAQSSCAKRLKITKKSSSPPMEALMSAEPSRWQGHFRLAVCCMLDLCSKTG
jgi:hypothetical protein